MLAPASPESRLLYNYPSVPGHTRRKITKFFKFSSSTSNNTTYHSKTLFLNRPIPLRTHSIWKTPHHWNIITLGFSNLINENHPRKNRQKKNASTPKNRQKKASTTTNFEKIPPTSSRDLSVIISTGRSWSVASGLPPNSLPTRLRFSPKNFRLCVTFFDQKFEAPNCDVTRRTENKCRRVFFSKPLPGYG